MAPARRQFTIRGLMIAVAVIAVSLAVALNHWELLPLLLIAGIPVGGLIGLLRRVPRDRPGWRIGVRAAMLGWLMLGGGWFWAQLFVWWFKEQAKLHGVGARSYVYDNRSWWLNVPLFLTAFFLIAHALGLARLCWGRRQGIGCLYAFAYAMALAVAYLLMAATLEIQLM
jgi:hypothetical protein